MPNAVLRRLISRRYHCRLRRNTTNNPNGLKQNTRIPKTLRTNSTHPLTGRPLPPSPPNVVHSTTQPRAIKRRTNVPPADADNTDTSVRPDRGSNKIHPQPPDPRNGNNTKQCLHPPPQKNTPPRPASPRKQHQRRPRMTYTTQAKSLAVTVAVTVAVSLNPRQHPPSPPTRRQTHRDAAQHPQHATNECVPSAPTTSARAPAPTQDATSSQ